MSWVVDTCVILDVLEADPQFGESSARCLARLLPEGLLVCPITWVELAPAFDGSVDLQDEFLRGLGAPCAEPWDLADTLAAHRAWHGHVSRRRAGGARRPIADLLIGAFASRRRGLVTRNPRDFRGAFPGLRVVDPTQTA